MKIFNILLSVLLVFHYTFLFAPFQISADQVTRIAKLTEIKGDVTLKRGGGLREFQAFDGMGVLEGDYIRTGKDGFVKIVYDEKTEAVIGPGSEVMLSKLESSEELEKAALKLWSGKVYSKVKKVLNADEDYKVETPTAVMGVRGTLFLVTLDQENQSSSVLVFDGTVGVAAGNQGKDSKQDDTEILVDIYESADVSSDVMDAEKANKIDLEKFVENTEPEILIEVVESIIDETKQSIEESEGLLKEAKEQQDQDKMKQALKMATKAHLSSIMAENMIKTMQKSAKKEEIEQILIERNTSLEDVRERSQEIKQTSEDQQDKVKEEAEEYGVSEEEIDGVIEMNQKITKAIEASRVLDEQIQAQNTAGQDEEGEDTGFSSENNDDQNDTESGDQNNEDTPGDNSEPENDPENDKDEADENQSDNEIEGDEEETLPEEGQDEAGNTEEDRNNDSDEGENSSSLDPGDDRGTEDPEEDESPSPVNPDDGGDTEDPDEGETPPPTNPDDDGNTDGPDDGQPPTPTNPDNDGDDENPGTGDEPPANPDDDGTNDEDESPINETVQIDLEMGSFISFESGITVDLSSVSSNLPEGISLTIQEDPVDPAAVDPLLKKAGEIVSFAFKDSDGNIINDQIMQENIQIGIPIDESYEGDLNKLGIFYYNETDGYWKHIPSIIEGNMIITDVEHFSTYGVLEAPASIIPEFYVNELNQIDIMNKDQFDFETDMVFMEVSFEEIEGEMIPFTPDLKITLGPELPAEFTINGFSWQKNKRISDKKSFLIENPFTLEGKVNFFIRDDFSSNFHVYLAGYQNESSPFTSIKNFDATLFEGEESGTIISLNESDISSYTSGTVLIQSEKALYVVQQINSDDQNNYYLSTENHVQASVEIPFAGDDFTVDDLILSIQGYNDYYYGDQLNLPIVMEVEPGFLVPSDYSYALQVNGHDSIHGYHLINRTVDFVEGPAYFDQETVTEVQVNFADSEGGWQISEVIPEPYGFHYDMDYQPLQPKEGIREFYVTSNYLYNLAISAYNGSDLMTYHPVVDQYGGTVSLTMIQDLEPPQAISHIYLSEYGSMMMADLTVNETSRFVHDIRPKGSEAPTYDELISGMSEPPQVLMSEQTREIGLFNINPGEYDFYIGLEDLYGNQQMIKESFAYYPSLSYLADQKVIEKLENGNYRITFSNLDYLGMTDLVIYNDAISEILPAQYYEHNISELSVENNDLVITIDGTYEELGQNLAVAYVYDGDGNASPATEFIKLDTIALKDMKYEAEPGLFFPGSLINARIENPDISGSIELNVLIGSAELPGQTLEDSMDAGLYLTTVGLTGIYDEVNAEDSIIVQYEYMSNDMWIPTLYIDHKAGIILKEEIMLDPFHPILDSETTVYADESSVTEDVYGTVTADVYNPYTGESIQIELTKDGNSYKGLFTPSSEADTNDQEDVLKVFPGQSIIIRLEEKEYLFLLSEIHYMG
ncbi:MAG: FecR domain-containing protein [Bacillaceae bacterium]|nr:FecR domain-containing protein [Bacillaceae bacterium]